MRTGTLRRPVSGFLARRLEKPLLALEAALEGDALIKAAFRVLKAAVACDFVNVCLRIVPRGDGSLTYRMIDSRGRKFGTELLEGAFFQAHPGMPVLMANPGIRFINTREILAPDAVLHQTRFYREVMAVVGFRHAVAMFFWENPPQTPEAIFSLLRAEGRPDFDDGEVALLDRLYPHLDVALRRVRIAENERAVRKELHALTQTAPRAVCMLDWNLRVADANRAARESCAQWNLGAARALSLKPRPFHLPASLRETCLALKAQWQASLREHPNTGEPKSRVVPHPRRADWQATVSLHAHHSAPLGKPGFLTEFDHAAALPTDGTKERDRSRSAFDGLAERERELTRLVCAGKSNQEIADATGRTLGTVKNRLHAIFKKLHVTSRTELISRLHPVSMGPLPGGG